MKHYRLIVVLFFASMFLLLSFLVRNVTIASAASVGTAAQPATPMTLDNHALIFAGIVFLVFGCIGLNVWHVSGEKNKRAQRAEWDRNGGPPAHGLIDNDPSIGAGIVGYLWIATGIYLAIAIMLGNLLWLAAIFGH